MVHLFLFYFVVLRTVKVSPTNYIPVVVIEKLTGNTNSYTNIAYAKRAIDIGPTINSGTIRAKYIKTGKLYKIVISK